MFKLVPPIIKLVWWECYQHFIISVSCLFLIGYKQYQQINTPYCYCFSFLKIN